MSSAVGAVMLNAGHAIRARLQKAYSIVPVMLTVGALATGIATPGSATLLIGMTPGHPIAIDVTPQSTVVTVNDARPVCVVVVVKTALYGWSLDASYTATSSAPLDLALEPVSGGSCAITGTAGAAVHLGAAAGTKTTLAANQRSSQALAYALAVRSSAHLAAPVTVTVTFTAEAVGAPAAEAPVALALGQSGRVSLVRP
jgi:hypothetical protein